MWIIRGPIPVAEDDHSKTPSPDTPYTPEQRANDTIGDLLHGRLAERTIDRITDAAGRAKQDKRAGRVTRGI